MLLGGIRGLLIPQSYDNKHGSTRTFTLKLDSQKVKKWGRASSQSCRFSRLKTHDIAMVKILSYSVLFPMMGWKSQYSYLFWNEIVIYICKTRNIIHINRKLFHNGTIILFIKIINVNKYFGKFLTTIFFYLRNPHLYR